MKNNLAKNKEKNKSFTSTQSSDIETHTDDGEPVDTK